MIYEEKPNGLRVLRPSDNQHKPRGYDTTYDEEADTLTFHADGAVNAAGGQLDVEVVVWDKSDINDKLEIGMSSSNNSEWKIQRTYQAEPWTEIHGLSPPEWFCTGN